MNLSISPSRWITIGWAVMIPITASIHPYVGIPFLFIFICKQIIISCWSYEFYDEVMVEKKGVFNVTREEVHYNRIKSVMVEEPLIMRFFGLQVIHVMSSEQFKPLFTFYGIEGGEHIKDLLTKIVKISRKESGLRELDIFNTN
jgi:membrane protein YdbS with pleckstrin-like domain